MNLWWCGWNAPMDIPAEHTVPSWPSHIQAWLTGRENGYNIFVGATWARTTTQAMDGIRSCYGPSASRIVQRWVPKLKADNWNPGPGYSDFDLPKPGAKTGEQLRDAGMAQVSENAGEWRDVARAAAERWFNQLPAGMQFTAEDIRDDIQSTVGTPHHDNAWSAVLGGRARSWLKNESIVFIGTRTASRPQAHARILRVYRKL